MNFYAFKMLGRQLFNIINRKILYVFSFILILFRSIFLMFIMSLKEKYLQFFIYFPLYLLPISNYTENIKFKLYGNKCLCFG